MNDPGRRVIGLKSGEAGDGAPAAEGTAQGKPLVLRIQKAGFCVVAGLFLLDVRAYMCSPKV